MSQTPTKVEVGQVWQDWDSRLRPAGGSLYRVMALGITIKGIDGQRPTERYESALVSRCDRNGDVIENRLRPIRLSRFRPNSTGYRLISAPPVDATAVK